jgi:hypothetical protein
MNVAKTQIAIPRREALRCQKKKLKYYVEEIIKNKKKQLK